MPFLKQTKVIKLRREAAQAYYFENKIYIDNGPKKNASHEFNLITSTTHNFNTNISKKYIFHIKK